MAASCVAMAWISSKLYLIGMISESWNYTIYACILTGFIVYVWRNLDS